MGYDDRVSSNVLSSSSEINSREVPNDRLQRECGCRDPKEVHPGQ